MIPQTALPSQDVIRSRPWQIAVGAVVAVILLAFLDAVRFNFHLWTTKADYSHGLLIVPFAAYLLWSRRDAFPSHLKWPDPWGLPFMVAAAVIYFALEKYNIAKEWGQGFAVILALAGVVVMFCGRWGGLGWAWPALVFIPLAFQLPNKLETDLSGGLRTVATRSATATFQTIGLPAYSEGNIIAIGDTRLGVEAACSGLSMLLTFVAVAAVVAFLSKSRPLLDRLLILASAVPIAVFCNVIRIIVTGLVYHAGWTQLGDLIVHDLFGWLMMPMALGLIWLELKLLDWLLVPDQQESQRDAVLKDIRSKADHVLVMPRGGPVPSTRPGGR